MAKRPGERALEKVIPKLKENVTRSEKFIKSEAIDLVNEKIDSIILNVQGMIKRKGSSLSLILNDLENMRDNLAYYVSAVGRTTKNYDTYVYALETLYREYSNGANEPAKIVKEVHSKKNLVSDQMYDKIISTLKGKGLTAFNTATGDKIGIPRATFFRFIEAALQRGQITKLSKGKYGFAAERIEKP